MQFFVQILSALCLWLSVITKVAFAADCQTFAESCVATLGQPLHYSTGDTFIKLGPGEKYYMTFGVR